MCPVISTSLEVSRSCKLATSICGARCKLNQIAPAATTKKAAAMAKGTMRHYIGFGRTGYG